MLIYIFIFLLSFVLYSVYIEIAPDLGRIWIRPDVNCNARMSIPALLRYTFKTPFEAYFLWTPAFWTANGIIGCFFLFLCFLGWIKFLEYIQSLAQRHVNKQSGICHYPCCPLSYFL